jgi:hypothetical protein
LLAGVLVITSLAGTAWAFWSRTTQDPWLRLLDRARRSAIRAGAAVPPQATPRQLLTLLKSHDWPAHKTDAWAQWLMRMEIQRYDPQSGLALGLLRREFGRLPPWPHSLPSDSSTPQTAH